MSSRSDKYLIEPARPEDGRELLHILDNTVYPGNVSLIYTRRPDAYRSFYKEGEEVRLFVCRDQENRKIAGLGATVIREMYINRELRRAAYLFGLKVAPEYRGRFPLLPDCYAHLHEYLKKKKVDYCFTTILSGNEQARKLLEKKRAVMPTYQSFGRYETYALRNLATVDSSHNQEIRKACAEDIPVLVRFLNREAQKHQFCPLSRARDWTGVLDNGLGIQNVYLLEEGGEILAAGAVWDQSDYKQYIVKGYQGGLRILSTFPRLARMCGFPALPLPGEPVRFYTLARWAVRDNNPHIFNSFLNQVMAATVDYPLCLIGLHEGHPLREQLQQRKHVRYDSQVYLVTWEKDHNPVQEMEPMTVYLECGAL